MIKTYKILRGVDGVDRVEKKTWFGMANECERRTTQAADPWNVKPQNARLNIRMNFYSNRVVADWNKIPRGLMEQHQPTHSRKAMQNSVIGWSNL